MNKEDLQALIHQHVMQLTCAGIPTAAALEKACDVACLVFDDTTFDTALTDAAGRVNVDPALAALPRGTDEAGGATAALSI